MDEKYYLGVDLHRETFTVYGTDNKGQEIIKGKYQNSYDSINSVLAKFPIRPDVAVEATRNWMWFVNHLQNKGCVVKLAHPTKTKAIASARIKTDSIDARILCHLLRSDMIPSSYIASIKELDDREIARARIQFVKDQTKIKNRIMAALGKENLRFGGTDLFGSKGRDWLYHQRMSPVRRQVIELNLTRLDNVRDSIKKIDEIIKKRAVDIPEVELLMSIPSIGPTTAFTILAEIGNIERFVNAHKLTAYLGLVPRLSQSANHAYYGRITKLGNTYVRWSLGQAAHRLARIEPWAKKFVYRLSIRGGKKKAIVALSRKLATIIYHVLKEKRSYITNYSRP